MAMSPNVGDREKFKFVEDGAGNTAVRILNGSEAAANSSFTWEVKSAITNAQVKVTAVTGQYAVRLVPLDAGTLHWGPSGVTAAGSEGFTRTSVLEIDLPNDIFIINEASANSMNCAVYRFIRS